MSQAVAGLGKPLADAVTLTYRKVTWRLLPFLLLCYITAYLDRVNIGFAKLQMLGDLHFSEAVYGLGAGIFFIGYFLFEVPSNIILHRIGARVWIARVMLTWAVISAAMMFVKTPGAFYVLRFLLGVAEAGLFPGLVLYLTYWYPAKRRAQVITLFMTGIPLAGVIGAPLSGWILTSMTGVDHLAGWQWLFVIEALPSLITGIAVLFVLKDRIDDARWLDDNEKAIVKREVSADQGEVKAHKLSDGFTQPRVWLLSLIYFFFIMGLYGVGFWLPTLIKGTGIASPMTIGLLTTIPYAVATIAMITFGRLSDARGERRWHLVIPGLVGTVGWLISTTVTHSPLMAELSLIVATTGVLVTLSLFWCLPTALLAGAAAASGIAVINSVGNLAGFVSPYAIGWIIDHTHSTQLGVYTLAASLFVGSLLVLTLNPRLVNR